MQLTLAPALLLLVLAPADRLASEVQRLRALAQDAKAGEALKPIEADLAAGRRWAALHRLAPQFINLGGSTYVDGLAADLRDEAGFEKEWARVGAVLAGEGPRTALETAALRAEAEATLPQAAIMREASLEYGRNTEPKYGLFYLGSALAAKDFVELCRGLETASTRRAPPLRSIRAELDSLQQELLAAYRPPVSVERHSEFIGASSALKEARALDAAGQRHGALLRYLTACARCSPLLDSAPVPSAEELVQQLDGFAARLEGGELDHSIAQVFLEYARSEIALAPGTSPPIAVSIARRSLPRYFAALEPEVIVTLVRWPFT